MRKYINGEIYRLLRKKSMYIYFCALAVGYMLITYIRSGGFNATAITSEANTWFFLLPPLAGGFLFAAVYTDDLNAKNLITLVGFGMSKTKIVIAKLILMVIGGVIVFGVVPLLHCGLFVVCGWMPASTDIAVVYALSCKNLLISVAFAALSGIVVYGLQRATFAIVTYLLLAFNVVSSLLSAGLKMFGDFLSEYLMPGISNRILFGMISGDFPFQPLIEYAVYVIIAVVISVLAFRKKEMEF